MGKKENAESGSAFGKPYQTSLLLKYSAITASIIVILAGIHAARSILGPFLMAIFFAVLLITPINWLKKKGFSSWFSLTVVIIAVAVCGLGAATIAGGQLAQFARNIPNYRDRFDETLRDYNLRIDDFLPSFLKSDGKDDKKPNGNGNDAEEESESDAERDKIARRPRPLRVAKNVVAEAPEGDANETVDAAPEEANAASLKPTQAAYLAPAAATAVLPDAMVEGAAEGTSPDAVAVARTSDDYLDGAFSDGERRTILPDEPQDGLTPPINASGLTEIDANDAFFGDEASAEDEEWNEDDVPRGVDSVSLAAVNASSTTLFKFLASLAGELSYIASSAFLVTLLLIFMLVETSKIPAKLVAAIGRRRFVNSHIENVIADIRNYMVIKTEMSLLVGCCVTILMTVTKVQYPILWGFVAFLLNYIPNIGSTVASIPPIVLATIDRGMMIGCIDCVALITINCVVGYVLEPRLLGKGLDLSPLIVLIALIFFGWLLGPVGMFLSPPLAVVMKIIFNAFPETEWIAALMANRPPKSKYSD